MYGAPRSSRLGVPVVRVTSLAPSSRAAASATSASSAGVLVGTVRPEARLVPIAQKWHCSRVPQ
jgi:hypothetical protein